MRHKVTDAERTKRLGDRRFMVLEALLEGPVIPVIFAREQKLHPTTAYRALERLRKGGSAERAGWGLGAEYTITQRGKEKLQFGGCGHRMKAHGLLEDVLATLQKATKVEATLGPYALLTGAAEAYLHAGILTPEERDEWVREAKDACAALSPASPKRRKKRT